MIIDRAHAPVRSISARARSTRSVAVVALSSPTNTAIGVVRASSCITVLMDRSGRGVPATSAGLSMTGSGRTNVAT